MTTRGRRLIVAAALALAGAASAWIFASVDGGSHSVSDTLAGAVVPIAAVWAVAAAAVVTTARTMRGR